jgi:hypothetical protein
MTMAAKGLQVFYYVTIAMPSVYVVNIHRLFITDFTANEI